MPHKSLPPWVSKCLRDGITPAYESSISRYVHELLRAEPLGWPMGCITPEKTARTGVIGFALRASQSAKPVYAAVTKYRGRLHRGIVADYFAKRTAGLRVAALTNFVTWQVYAGGDPVREATGEYYVRVMEIELEISNDLALLANLIGYREAKEMKAIRAILGAVARRRVA